MNLEDSKKAILVMAKKIEEDTLTYQDVTEFVLSFRTMLWNDILPAPPLPSGQYPIVSCSCAAEVDSCQECGPEHYTKFYVNDGQIISFTKVSKK